MGRRYVFRKGHPLANDVGMVDVDLLGDWDAVNRDARNAPIMVDRFYEGTKATDGTDIGSRKKHRDYMKRMGITHSSDFSPQWYESRRREHEREDKSERREAVARATYEVLDRRK